MDEANAKIVVLGDSNHGKSSLINSLNPRTIFNKTKNNKKNDDHLFFSIIEYPSSYLEYDGPDTNIYLKVWEYGNTNQEETELAYRGALFCFIVLDITSSESAITSFEKWLSIKKQYMNESFLFVIGTFADMAAQRRLDMADMCKLCAQHDGMYLEVSNFDGSNISLLRKLLGQRLSYMLTIRDKLKNNNNMNLNNDNDDIYQEKFSERKSSDDIINININPPFLEQDIIADSVGSILSSCLGIEFWPGYEAEEENLKNIGSKISSLVNQVMNDPTTLPVSPLEFPLVSSFDYNNNHEPNLDELKNMFDTMGLPLPESLNHSTNNSNNNHLNTISNTDSPSSSSSKNEIIDQKIGKGVKLRVRLPDGNPADLVIYPEYDIESQVTVFMSRFGIENNISAKNKLVEVAQVALKLEVGSKQEKLPFQVNKPQQEFIKPPQDDIKKKKVRLKLKLPNGNIENVDVQISSNDKMENIAHDVAMKYQLTADYERKIYNHLQNII